MEPKSKKPNCRLFDKRQDTVYRINLALQEHALFEDGIIEDKCLLTDEQLDLGISMTGCEDLDNNDKFEWLELPDVRKTPLITDWENANESLVSPVCYYDNFTNNMEVPMTKVFEIWYESFDGSEKVTEIEAVSINDASEYFNDEYKGCRIISIQEVSNA